jgi:hypothetical protein
MKKSDFQNVDRVALARTNVSEERRFLQKPHCVTPRRRHSSFYFCDVLLLGPDTVSGRSHIIISFIAALI